MTRFPLHTERTLTRLAHPYEIPTLERMGYRAVSWRKPFIVMEKDEPDRDAERLKAAVLATWMGFNI